MKECPSCHSRIQTQLIVCPQCGYAFDGDGESSTGDVKKTMMGIPSVDMAALRDIDLDSEPGDTRSTMFGFPVDDAFKGDHLVEGTNPYEDNATQIVDADQFSFDDLEPSSIDSPQDEGDAVRSTIMGGFPSIAALQQESNMSSHEEESSEFEDESRTMVASASAFQFDGKAEDIASSEPVKPMLHERPKKHETLMGMTLDDLAPEGTKHTLFSIPSQQFDVGEGLSEFSEESEAEEDIPTQAISGAAFMREPERDTTREQNRQRLLDKLRAHHQSEQSEPEQSRSTMFGLPAVSKDSVIPEEDRIVDNDSARLTPHTGVLKVAARKPLSLDTGSGLAETSSPTGVLGSSSYMMSKENAVEEPAEPEAKKVPSLNLSQSLRDKLKQKSEAPARATALTHKPMIEELQAPQAPVAIQPVQDKTQVVSDSTLKEVLSGSFDAIEPPASQEPSEVDDDHTRAQSLSDLKEQLRQSSQLSALEPSARVIEQDATRQHDMGSLREQLGASLFDSPEDDNFIHDEPTVAGEELLSDEENASPVSLSGQELDSTRVAPAHLVSESVPTALPSSGPRFATGLASTSSNSFSDDIPSLDDMESFPLEPEISVSPINDDMPSVDVSPLEPEVLPLVQPEPISVAPEPLFQSEPVQPAPVVAQPPVQDVPEIPMVAAEPLPTTPSFKTTTDTHSPTPPHGTAVGSPASAPKDTKEEGGVGRTLMVVFGVLGLLSFVAAIVLPLVGVMHDPAEALPPISYAPAGLAVLALLGVVIPKDFVKQVFFVLAALAGIGVFAACLLMGAPIVCGIMALVGALFCATALFFPLLAKSL